jgi:heme exporter protein D
MAILSMGGYGGYVWPAYVLAALVMAGLLAVSLIGARQSEKELARLQLLRPDRAARRAAQQEASK